jgi:hypothetical protein
MSPATPKTKKRGGTSRRVAVGGGAILILGIIMGMFMDLPGLGSGTIASKGKRTTATTAPPETISPDTEADDSPPTVDLITVLIDDRSYSLVKKVGEETVFSPVELSSIVDQATKVSGNEDGIRVRILRRESARYMAETDLRKALADAGIENEAVYMPNTFVQ